MSALGPSLLLLFTAAIWGSAFLAQKEGGDHFGPFAFTALRSALGFLFLLLVLAGRRALRLRPRRRAPLRTTLLGGAACGAALFGATALQQAGLADTSAGVSAFVTATYVLLVPILGLALGAVPRPYVWGGVLVSLAGLFLICIDPAEAGFRIGRGEALTLACAAVFAVQILLVAHFARRCDGLALSAVQLLAGCLLGLPLLALPSESARLGAAALRAAAGPLLFAGVLSSGVAYTLQIVAQNRVAPPLAAMLMSLESAFALLFQYVLPPHVAQTPRQLLGCALVFAAVAAVQVFDARRPRAPAGGAASAPS